MENKKGYIKPDAVEILTACYGNQGCDDVDGDKTAEQ